jgi:F-type H+-transporting ATPase subunit epsilon
MKLKVWVPTEVVFDQEVTKIKAEAENGWFGILPRHVDFVTSLVPGILCFDLPGKQSGYLAIDHGILVKCGPVVYISTRSAVLGEDLGTLREAVNKQFRMLHDKEQAARELEAKLEADLVRQLMQMEEHA